MAPGICHVHVLSGCPLPCAQLAGGELTSRPQTALSRRQLPAASLPVLVCIRDISCSGCAQFFDIGMVCAYVHIYKRIHFHISICPGRPATLYTVICPWTLHVSTMLVASVDWAPRMCGVLNDIGRDSWDWDAAWVIEIPPKNEGRHLPFYSKREALENTSA